MADARSVQYVRLGHRSRCIRTWRMSKEDALRAVEGDPGYFFAEAKSGTTATLDARLLIGATAEDIVAAVIEEAARHGVEARFSPPFAGTEAAHDAYSEVRRALAEQVTLAKRLTAKLPQEVLV